MDPSQAELHRVIPQYIEDGRILELVVFLAIFYLPLVPALWKDWRSRRQVKQLYNDRLSDKDKEIGRLADRIKELENQLLKARRK